MINKIKKIHSLLDKSLNSELIKDEKYNKNHIFFDFLKFVHKDISSDEKTAMLYEFHTYNKSLDEARKDDLNLSKFWIDYGYGLNFKHNNNVRKSLDSLRYPMLAFYDLKNKNYNSSIENLKNSILCLNELEENGIETAIWAIIEQIHNVSKVEMIKGNHKDSIKILSDLISLLTIGKPNDFINQKNNKLIGERLFQEKISLVDYFIDSILTKMDLNIYKTDTYGFISQIFLIEEIKKSKIESLNIAYLSSICALDKSVLNNENTFLNYFEETIEKLNEVPKIIKFNMFEKFIGIVKTSKYDEKLNLIKTIEKIKEVNFKNYNFIIQIENLN